MYGNMLIFSIVFFLIIYVASSSNAIQKLRSVTNNSFAQLDVQLKYRQEVADDLVKVFQRYFTTHQLLIEKLNAIIVLAKKLQSDTDHCPENITHISDYIVIQDKLTDVLNEFCEVISQENGQYSEDVLLLLGDLEKVKESIELTNKTYNQWVDEVNKEIDGIPKALCLLKKIDKQKFEPMFLSV